MYEDNQHDANTFGNINISISISNHFNIISNKLFLSFFIAYKTKNHKTIKILIKNKSTQISELYLLGFKKELTINT